MPYRELSIREKVTRKTLFQAVALALIAGPLFFSFKDDHSLNNLLWCCAGMFLAPFVVDALRPTFVREG